MRLRRRKNVEAPEETITEVVVTETDQVVLSMSGSAERLCALDAEMVAAFLEWRAAQGRCLEQGLLVEVKMNEPMRVAYQTWLAEQYASSSSDDTPEEEAVTQIITASPPERHGAGEHIHQAHGWPLRAMVPARVEAW